MLNRMNPEDVKMMPGLFLKRMNLNEDYLIELDEGCLLQNFYLEAGIIPPGGQVINDPASAKMHWGWEAPSCQLRGHFLGHWLSAAAMLCAGGEKPLLSAKINRVVSELKRCQLMNGGEWAGSIPEKYFDMMRPGRYIWSPQYTMHKTLMGLTDVYRLLGNELALDILSHQADWYVRWVAGVQKESPEAVFSGEQAGMLEIWSELSDLTGEEKYRMLRDIYAGNVFFDRLDHDGDALTDEHANASIPLSHGIAALYESTGDEKWLRRMESFWNMAVRKRGMFSTTGSNAGEFWIPPHAHASYLSDTVQEFCTVYNMVRTAEYLFRWTGSSEYADYIETALYNGFLAQQNRITGMPCYFLSLSPGSRKKWGTRTRDFWCCFGTMIQAQALYPRLIWYTQDDTVTVSQYIPSAADLHLKCGPVRVTQQIQMKNRDNQVLFEEHSGGPVSRWSLRFSVESHSACPWTLKLRVPSWCAGDPVLQLNGKPLSLSAESGYISICRVWSDDILDVFFPAALRFVPLDGSEELVSVMEGPVVLAGLTDTDCGLHGSADHPESLFLADLTHTYDTFVWKQSCYTTRGQTRNFRFIPLYDVTDEVYTVYFSSDR